jgi:uncharacterized protein (TIGR00266 family)
MQVEVMHGPANAAAKVRLQGGQSFTAEAGAMIAMSQDVRIETTTHKKQSRGVLKAIKRMLGGESFFLNHFTAGPQGGEVWVAPVLPGDMLALNVTTPMVVQGGSFLAADPAINVDMSWQGFKSLFSGEQVFWLKLTGQGQAVINSFGAIYPLDIDGEYIVDSGHIVAFPETMTFEITKAGKSWISSILGGEGLVCKFKGKGRIWCQSHNAHGFGSTLGPLLKPRSA